MRKYAKKNCFIGQTYHSFKLTGQPIYNQYDALYRNSQVFLNVLEQLVYYRFICLIKNSNTNK